MIRVLREWLWLIGRAHSTRQMMARIEYFSCDTNAENAGGAAPGARPRPGQPFKKEAA